MYKLLTTTAILLVAGVSSHAQELNSMQWGGAYSAMQLEAYQKDFSARNGTRINVIDVDNPAAPIKAQVLAGNVTIDVATVLATDAARLCDEGLLEELDLADLPAAPDGTPASEDFIPGALTDCSVASDVYSWVISYDETKVKNLESAKDFFDLGKIPGKRAVPRNPQGSLEIALLADGVPTDQVYEVLATKEGADRAFAKLDTIKSSIVWWEAGAQPPQLLADGEVALAIAYNGRIFDAAIAEGKPFGVIWDGQLMDLDVFVIPRGAPNKELAWEYIKFATATQQNANQTKWISYGPTRRSALALVTTYNDGKTEMATQLPTAAENLDNAVLVEPAFWADHGTELSERFNVWLSAQ